MIRRHRQGDHPDQSAFERAACLPRRLAPAVETAIEFLRAMVQALPGARACRLQRGLAETPPCARSFVAPTDIPAALGRSDNLRTLFDKFPELDEACLVLGMAFNEQRVFGMALQGDMVQRDVVQTSVSFSDHRAHICGRDESRLRRVVGDSGLRVSAGPGAGGDWRGARRKAGAGGNRALIRARLRLLQQQGPGLGSMFGTPPAARSEQARLETELLENDRQLAAIGGSESALEAELECLTEVLGHPERYLRVEQKQLRLNAMNVVADKASTDPAADVDFSIADLAGAQAVRRAFVVASVARGEVPSTPRINFDDAARLL
jgi:hypothetical protein